MADHPGSHKRFRLTPGSKAASKSLSPRRTNAIANLAPARISGKKMLKESNREFLERTRLKSKRKGNR